MKKSGQKIGTRSRIVYENTDYGTSVADNLRDAAKAANLPITADISYCANTTDVSPQVLQLKEKNPDVVIFISYTSDAILYMKTMKNLDYLPTMVIGDDSGFSDPSYIKNVGAVAQGVHQPQRVGRRQAGSPTTKINELYKAKTGCDLDDTAARDMQGFFVLADAINRAGSTEPEAIQKALQQDRPQARPADDRLQGRQVRRDRAERAGSTYLIQLQGTRFELVWPETAANATLQWPMAGWAQ